MPSTFQLSEMWIVFTFSSVFGSMTKISPRFDAVRLLYGAT